MSCQALIVLVWLAIASEELPSTKDAAVAIDPRAMEVQLADGSVLKLLLADEKIAIVTPHGNLLVPADEIRRIEFAQRLPKDTNDRIGELLNLLRNSDAEVHEPAAAELVALGAAAYLPLVKAASGGDLSLVTRAGEVLGKVRGALPAGAIPRADDLIETGDAKIAGQIAMPTLKVHTTQFGELALKLADARSLRHQSLIARPVEKEPENVLPDPGHLQGYEARQGETFAFRVTGVVAGGTIWGTDVYTTDSSLAMAAVHAGVLKPGQTGTVRVKIIPSPLAFAASVRNGVQSHQFGRFNAAFQILKDVKK